MMVLSSVLRTLRDRKKHLTNLVSMFPNNVVFIARLAEVSFSLSLIERVKNAKTVIDVEDGAHREADKQREGSISGRPEKRENHSSVHNN